MMGWAGSSRKWRWPLSLASSIRKNQVFWLTIFYDYFYMLEMYIDCSSQCDDQGSRVILLISFALENIHVFRICGSRVM